MHTRPNPFLIVAIALVALSCGWVSGRTYETYQAGRSGVGMVQTSGQNGGSVDAQSGDPEAAVNLSILWNSWRLLQKHYIEPAKLEQQKMVYGAVSGMVQAVGDPYSVFMDPSQNQEFKDTLGGTLEGIGAELTMRDGLPVIVSPVKGSPAEKAGLLPQDIIVEVNDKSTADRNLIDVIHDIRGQRGTEVKLTVVRKEQRLTFTIVRQKIDLPSVEFEVKKTGSGSVGVISINQFGEHTTEEVQKAMTLFAKEPLDGLVVDVRFNGGGYLDRAVELTSMFVESGKVVSVARRTGTPETHYVTGSPIDTATPMVVLQNQGSASASEILAGALHDHGRAVLIGTKSFGKGTIQEIFPLSGGSSLRVTVAKWLTPNGTDIGHQGIEPDYKVERTAEDSEAGYDPQMQAALEYLLDGELPAQTGTGSTL